MTWTGGQQCCPWDPPTPCETCGWLELVIPFHSLEQIGDREEGQDRTVSRFAAPAPEVLRGTPASAGYVVGQEPGSTAVPAHSGGGGGPVPASPTWAPHTLTLTLEGGHSRSCFHRSCCYQKLPLSYSKAPISPGWAEAWYSSFEKATKARRAQPSPLLTFVLTWSLEPSPSSQTRPLGVFSTQAPAGFTLWVWGGGNTCPSRGAQPAATPRHPGWRSPARRTGPCPGHFVRPTQWAKSPPPPGRLAGPSPHLPPDYPLLEQGPGPVVGPEVGAVPPGATARKAKPLLAACLPNREKRAPKAKLSQGRNGQCQDPAALALRHCPSLLHPLQGRRALLPGGGSLDLGRGWSRAEEVGWMANGSQSLKRAGQRQA